MKKHNGRIAVLFAAALLIGGVMGWLLAGTAQSTVGNYSDEMKMEYRTDYADGGANAVEQ